MSRPEIRVFEDPDAVCAAAADEFVASATAAREARGRFRVALAGGTTPGRLHGMLVGSPWREQVDWTGVRFFFGDERSVPADHADSNYRMARETLLGALAIPEQNVHRMQAERTDLAASARDYQRAIAEEFACPADGSPPAFDLILLGMGPDGHTASLFPGTRALDETERWVVGNEVPRLATSRMTFTLPLLNAARCVVFTITGAAKAEALQAALAPQSDPRPARPPIAAVAPEAGRLIYLLDRDAASRLAP